VFGGRPQQLGRDANATSRPRRGGGRARRGRGAGMARLGVVGSRGTGAHARARVLASQGRGVAVPCAGHRHPGPAARRGGDEATAVAGEDCGASGSCTRRTARRPEGTGDPTAGYGGFLSGARHHAGSRGGQERNGGGVAHRRGWSRGRSGQRRGEAGGSGPCRVRGCVGVVVRAQVR
jgi:hypothetical protein